MFHEGVTQLCGGDRQDWRLLYLGVMGVSTTNWGDVPGWVTSAATVFAVLAASYAGWKAAELLGVEHGRDQERRDNEVRDQSSRIAAWATEDVTPVQSNSSMFVGYSSMGIKGIALNGSAQPVFGVQVDWYFNEEVIQTNQCHVLAPGEQQQWQLADDGLRLVTGKIDIVAFQIHSSATVIAQAGKDTLRLEISFTDSVNRRWKRDRNGGLTLLN